MTARLCLALAAPSAVLFLAGVVTATLFAPVWVRVLTGTALLAAVAFAVTANVNILKDTGP